MKVIPAGKFKAQCLSLLKEISQKRNSIIITKYGKPIAQVIPVNDSQETVHNTLKDSILFEKNLIDPIDVDWEANK